MRTIIGTLLTLLTLFLLLHSAPVRDHAHAAPAGTPRAITPDGDDYRPEVLRRGSFRSPRMGYTGGSRARNPGVNQPGNRTPAAPARRAGGFMGGMFGGLLAGSLLGGMLGGLFNPFGIGTGNGFSLFGLLIWGVILYAAYRLFRRVTGRGK